MDLNHRKIKENKKLVLVSLYDPASQALRLLSTFLKERGFSVPQVYFKDLFTKKFPYTEKEKALFINLVKELKPDILGMSLRSSSVAAAIDLVKALRKNFLIPIIIGGTHATICPEECIKYADGVCIGEGEFTLLEIMQQFTGTKDSIKDVKGLWVRGEDKVYKNSLRNLIENLDELPLIDYSNDDKYLIESDMIKEGELLTKKSSLEVFTSRGCPFHCTYCSNNILKQIVKDKGNYVRQRSVNSTIAEIKHGMLQIPGIKKIVFGDEVFSFEPEWVEEFSRKYKKEIGLPFAAMFYPTLIDEKMLGFLKEAGLSHARTGIQSASERVRRTIYKREVKDEDILSAADKFHKFKLRFTFDLIVDNPYEMIKEKVQSLELLLRIKKPFELNLHSLVYFPKTEMTEMALVDEVITPSDVEGKHSYKGLNLQHVLSGKEKGDVFWNSLFSLTSKSFIPKSILRFFAKSAYLKEKPYMVYLWAKIANLLKLSFMAIAFLFKGEISIKDIFAGFKTFKDTTSVSK
ncbi:cobalamin-dependent protein [bacterium]|nr:cobalamin-dependent protein [bacterium]